MSIMKTELDTFLELDIVLSEPTKEIIILRTCLMINVPAVIELKQQNNFAQMLIIPKGRDKLYYLQSVLLSLQYHLKHIK